MAISSALSSGGAMSSANSSLPRHWHGAHLFPASGKCSVRFSRIPIYCVAHSVERLPLEVVTQVRVAGSSADLPSEKTTARDGQPAEALLIEAEKSSSDSLFRLQASPLSVLTLAALVPGAEQVTAIFEPYGELVRGLDLPDWLVHWGHPGNMAVVLLAMGGYGSWLGWQIRLSDDVAVKAKAKDLHPKLLAGLFFFFAAGALGGITSLVTSGKPIFESPHAVTGITGLALLAVQTTLPAFFEKNPDLRGLHAWFGSSIMTLFLVHFALGLQLGLSY